MSPRNRLCALAAISLGAALGLPAGAQASFGIEAGSVKVSAENRNGTPDLEAGSHPYAYTVSLAFNHDAEGNAEGSARDVLVGLPAGLIGNPSAVPRCRRQSFDGGQARCPGDTQIGTFSALFKDAANGTLAPGGALYNLVPLPGEAASFGFSAAGFVTVENATLVKREGTYRVEVDTNNVSHGSLLDVSQTVWGEPADEGHDAERICFNPAGEGEFIHGCPSTATPRPFLTLPSSCTGPLATQLEADSTEAPGIFGGESASSPGLLGCESVPFHPSIAASPTSKLTTNPSGLDFELKMPDFGLEDPGGVAETEAKKAEVTLPEGMTINPSEAEGIGVCTEAQIELEGEAAPQCPEASKIGSVEVHTPLLEEPLSGALYLAKPYENPSHSLIALYMTFKAPERGILVKLAGKVEPDPKTGQLVSTFENLPQVPFSDFKLHFREGARAPLVTPPACGTYTTVARFTPWSAQEPPGPGEVRTATSPFQIEHGADGGACPAGGLPPFQPGLLAGTLNNAAGAYSPFYLRLTRTDSEQEITHFSIKLPPGVVGKLAGIPFCPEAGIAQARSRERQPGGGTEELESPSCPKASEVGHTLVGVGVGGALTYVPGKVYLAGPYHGSAISIVAITAAKAGPFDLGTVVVREALKVNPETAEVFVDATGSDPIPHIVDGIPVHLRDIRVYVDRPEFVLNPTSCEPTSTASTVLGSGLDFASEADDVPVTVTTRFQAADCAALGFQPQIVARLIGSTKRGGNPSLQAILTPRPGDANITRVVTTLPHSEFLDNAHIRTVCTRVQFKEGEGNGANCPPGSVYGYARAITPLLSEPLEGPVFLRSSEHKLPDLVIALHGEVNIDAVGRVDSVNGRIRNTFETVPDAPLTKFVLTLGGGKKSLLENSTNLCVGKHRVIDEFTGHNGMLEKASPALQVKCPRPHRHKGKRKGRHGRLHRARG